MFAASMPQSGSVLRTGACGPGFNTRPGHVSGFVSRTHYVHVHSKYSFGVAALGNFQFATGSCRMVCRQHMPQSGSELRTGACVQRLPCGSDASSKKMTVILDELTQGTFDLALGVCLR